MRVHGDEAALHLGRLAQAVGLAVLRRLDIDDVAGIEHADRRLRRLAVTLGRAEGPAHVLGLDAARHALGDDLAGAVLARLEADIGTAFVHGEDDGELPFRHVGEAVDLGEFHAPVAADLDRLDRAVEAAALVVGDEAVLERLAGRDLDARVERGAHRKAALIKGVVAVALDDLAADLLGEIFRGEEMGAALTRRHAERLRLGFRAVGLADIAVLDHAVDHPVAALERGVRVAEGMVVRGALRQGGEVGGLGDRQFRHRLVEIGERGAGDAVGIEAEEDLVEVELEDAVLGIGLLDAEGEDRFLHLAVDRLVGGEQEVLGDLLGDGRGADRTAARAHVLDVDEDGAEEARHVDAGVLVEVLVFRRQEGGLHPIGDRLDRQEEAALAGIFGHQRAVAGMHAGRHRRRVAVEDLIVGKILRDTSEIERDRSRHAEERHGANPEEISNQSDHEPATDACILSFSRAALPPGLFATAADDRRAFACEDESPHSADPV